MNCLANIAIVVILTMVVSPGLYRQFKLDKAVLITKENGLPTHEVRSMKKGDDGFIWIATVKGLGRFDGQQMKIFNEGKDSKYSLYDDVVESVQPINNNIWFGT